MKSPNRKRWIITGVIAVLLVISPLIASVLLKELETILTRGKRAHDAKAIVIRKERVQFDEKKRFSINDDGVGYRVGSLARKSGEFTLRSLDLKLDLKLSSQQPSNC